MKQSYHLTFIIPKLWIKGAWEVSLHVHWLEGPKTLRTFLQSCSRGGGDKSYRHADQWWPEPDLLNVQNFVKSYLGPIACIGINSKSVRNSFACKRHRKEKRHNFRKPQSAKHLYSVYAQTVCQLEENLILIIGNAKFCIQPKITISLLSALVEEDKVKS